MTGPTVPVNKMRVVILRPNKLVTNCKFCNSPKWSHCPSNTNYGIIRDVGSDVPIPGQIVGSYVLCSNSEWPGQIGSMAFVTSQLETLGMIEQPVVGCLTLVWRLE